MSTAESQHGVLVGIDWGSEEHVAYVIDAQRRPLGKRTFAHTARDLAELASWLLDLAGGEASQVAVGIEAVRGPVVETLLERGFAVYGVNPKQVDRFRDRHRMSGAKDDPLDAMVIADSLRTDLHLFRRLRIDEPLVIQLREASRSLADLKEESGRLANRLRELLHRYFPQLLLLAPAADEGWLWDLLEKAPTPAKARRLNRTRLANLLREHRIRRVTVEQLREVLQQPELHVADGVVGGVSTRVGLLIPQLRLLAAQTRETERHIDHLLEQLAVPTADAEDPPGQRREHRDAEILLSLPGAGRVFVATMFAEASGPLARRDYQALRSLSGAAPVVRRTGKSGKPKRDGYVPGAVMRQACSAPLREAVFHFARVNTQLDERSRAHYERLIAKGHSHGRALRGVGDRLLAMTISMLKTGKLFDPERRGHTSDARKEAA